MSRSGVTQVTFNTKYFDNIMRTAGVQKLTDEAAKRVLGIAQVNAPVATGSYRDGLRIEHREARYRRVTLVVGTDRKTLLVESKTGNLARALKKGSRT